MRDIQSKREREKRMVTEMIALYCRKNHGTKKGTLRHVYETKKEKIRLEKQQ